MGQREITNAGINSQGNYYESFKGSSSDANQNSYHYHNQDGSYYSSNADGSKYYESPRGHASYTPPSSDTKK